MLPLCNCLALVASHHLKDYAYKLLSIISSSEPCMEVWSVRSNVKKRVLLESDASGVNKRKLIQKVLWFRFPSAGIHSFCIDDSLNEGRLDACMPSAFPPQPILERLWWKSSSAWFRQTRSLTN